MTQPTPFGNTRPYVTTHIHTPFHTTLPWKSKATIHSLEDDSEEVAFLFDLDMEHGSSSDESVDNCNLSARLFLGINGHADIFDEGEGSRQPPTSRGPERKRDPSSSAFGKLIVLADLHEQDRGSVWDEEHIDRLPYILFDKICKEYTKVDPRNTTDALHQPKSDSRLLLMGVMRYLGQGIPFDALEELSDISGHKHHDFFHEFVTWFSDSERYESAREYWKLPETDDEIGHVTRYYAAQGVTGCGGSIDCVHIIWDICPAGLRADCKGREKNPSVVFQVISSHTRYINGISGPYYGTLNDKTIAGLDKNLKAFMPDGNLAETKWTWMNSNNNKHEEKGLILICDGGF